MGTSFLKFFKLQSRTQKQVNEIGLGSYNRTCYLNKMVQNRTELILDDGGKFRFMKNVSALSVCQTVI